MKQAILVVIVGLMFFSCIDDNLKEQTAEEQFEADLVVIDNFLSQNNLTAEIEPNSQLRYIITQQGLGIYPEDTDSVTVNYVGSLLLTGDIFDEKDTITFKLNSLISAWRIGLPLLKEGGSMMLYVPSLYGYVNSDIPGIPPGSNIIFDLDLIEVK